MTNWQGKAESIKNQTRELLERLLDIRRQAATTGGELPQPDMLFNSALEGLSRTEFNIAVCGDVSQGKSSFINALIGRELLPTNEHPTTSQLFRISNGETESYRFVFADGTEKEFSSPDDLLRYGTVLLSQESVESKVIDYIDIRVRLQDVPKGVYIWDTPGLGVSHYSHEEITSRCISRCDAVIFLSQPKAMLTEKEIKFVSSVFARTPSVCFVQTIVDKYDEAVVNDIAGRNVEILEKEFGKHLREDFKVEPDFHFLACSSQNLLFSKTESNEQKRALFFKRSRFADLYKELGNFLYQTVCVKSVVLACAEYVKLHNKCVSTLLDSKKVLTSDTLEKKTALAKAKKSELVAFEEKWNVKTGVSYNVLKAHVEQIVRSAKAKAYQLFSRNSYLLDKYLRNLQALPEDPKAVKQYYEEVKTALPNEVTLEWQRIIDQTNAALYDRFAEFEAEFSPIDGTWTECASGGVQYKHKGLSAFTAIRNGTIGFSVVGGLALKAIAMAPITGGWSLVAAGMAALASAIWGAKKSIGLGAAAAAQQAKANLQRSLCNYFIDIQHEYATGDVGVESKIDACFGSLMEKVKDKVQSVVESERANMKAACSRLDQQALMDGQGTSEALKAIDRTLSALEDEKGKMVVLMKNVNESV